MTDTVCFPISQVCTRGVTLGEFGVKQIFFSLAWIQIQIIFIILVYYEYQYKYYSNFFWLQIIIWILFVRNNHEYIPIFEYLLHSDCIAHQCVQRCSAVQSGMSGNHFLNFRTGTGKPKKAFLVFGTGTVKTRSQSCSLGQEREIQETIPIVWYNNGKTQISFPLNRKGNLK